MSYPLNCTESCQRCYEKVIAGVKEYRCYGRCVVVDQMGISHNGPGEAAPADWTLSPEVAEVSEEMVAYMALYNNQQTPTATAYSKCCKTRVKCPKDASGQSGECWGDPLSPNCECLYLPGKPPKGWVPFPPKEDSLTQIAIEEQKAALATARLDFNKRGGISGPFKYRPKLFTEDQANIYCNCNGAVGCGDAAGACGGKCWWRNHLDVTKDDPNPVPLPGQYVDWKCSAVNEGPWSPDGDPLRETETEQVLKVALAKARKAANFDGTMQTAPNCCNGTACPDGYKCYRRKGTSECVCWPTMLAPNMPSPPPPPNIWVPYPPPTTALTPTVTTNTFNVINNASGNYLINGVSNATLSLTRGQTYTFNITAMGHPFWIKTVLSTGTGNVYNTGVMNNGMQNGTLTFVVPNNAPNTLYYNCQFHSSMAGTINIVNGTQTPTPMPTSLSCCSGGVSCVSPATCWRRIGITGVVECKCLSGNPNYPDSGGWTRFPRRAIGPIWA